MNQQTLLNLVEKWNLKKNPEYRGFKCGCCGKTLKMAWHHWLRIGDFITPIHFCKDCEKKYEVSKIKFNKPKKPIERIGFGVDYPNSIKKEMKEIIKKWDLTTRPTYKKFECDKCRKNIEKAWHCWCNVSRNLTEFHFCKKCGEKMSIKK